MMKTNFFNNTFSYDRTFVNVYGRASMHFREGKIVQSHKKLKFRLFISEASILIIIITEFN